MSELVDLQRHFAPIQKDDEPNVDAEDPWSQVFYGWIQWPQLLQKPRVVLLAEALSGKTSEFQHRQWLLEAEGKFAFFVTIERLADGSFEDALEPKQLESFKAWSASQDHAWFFLDSIDEARLNRKSFDAALSRFARQVNHALGRISVYVSCRMSDWNGSKDKEALNRLLPVPEATLSTQAPEENPLLEPLFGRAKIPTATLKSRAESAASREPFVVRLVPLTNEQRIALAVHAKVPHIEAFIHAIQMQGLSPLAERPGDLLDLAEYWKTNQKFGPYQEMVEFSVTRKLAEIDKYRPDNADLSPSDARSGAERLASALSLGKTWTLRSPGADPDPSLSVGALDPESVLPKWTDIQRNALLRRGLFAPATYGRVRFHRRLTQEYLFACWLHGLLSANCPIHEIWDLVFVEQYGVKTVPPSLHAAAAWLALKHPKIRNEIAAREPLILLRHGDPGSLPIVTRENLLRSFAQLHARGELSNSHVEPRNLWMFASPELGNAIREVWDLDPSYDFRTLLLHVIREGKISACVDLARVAACDQSLPDYGRSVALAALSACGDEEGLHAAARQLMANPTDTSAELASEFALELYPKYISTDDLLVVIERSQAPRAGRLEGFAQHIAALFTACPDANVRERFVSEISRRCLQPPFAQEYRRISARFADLANALLPVAASAVTALGEQNPYEGLIELLMVVERGHEHDNHEGFESLRTRVRANRALNRALFWADVGEIRRNGTGTADPIRHYHAHVHIHGEQLWELGAHDIDWLTEELMHRSSLADRRLVLGALLEVFQSNKQLSGELPKLRALTADDAVLASELNEYLSSREESRDGHEFRTLQQQHREKSVQKRKADEDSWVNFKAWLLENPSRIANPPDVGALKNLTQWLQRRSGAGEPHQAALQAPLLAIGFGPGIPEAYRAALQALWRKAKPARPTRSRDSITVRWENLLAVAGIGIEAAQGPQWIDALTSLEVVQAAKHACLSEQGHPHWLAALIDRHPTLVAPVILDAVKHEWRAEYDGAANLLSHYAQFVTDIPSALQSGLLNALTRTEPKSLNKLEHGLRVLGRVRLDEEQRRRLLRWTSQRVHKHSRAGQDERAVRYIVLHFFHDAGRAISALTKWIDGATDEARRTRAELAFGTFFGARGPSIVSLMESASITDLERLAHLAYQLINPKDDAEHLGADSPGYRDHAEDARNAVLKTLLNQRGEAAYAAALRLSQPTAADLPERRARQLAHQIAERDSDLVAWKTSEVLLLEERHTLPVRSGTDLLRAVIAVLNDIQRGLAQDDASSKELLRTAADEDAVQKWLTEQLNLRSNKRYHAHRESIVADENRPDITISSASSFDELATEVKHANKGWTVRQLEHALRTQLAKQYLRTSNRRHGVLVVTQHDNRTWRQGKGQPALSFDEVLSRLQSIASAIKENDTGSVEVRVTGLNVAG